MEENQYKILFLLVYKIPYKTLISSKPLCLGSIKLMDLLQHMMEPDT